MKTLIFGRGPIAQRMTLALWYARFEFKLQDLWVGAFWKTSGNCFDLWICFLPCVPLHVCLSYHDPEQ